MSSTIGFVHARRSQRRAENARAQAEAVNAFLRGMLGSASPTAEGVDVRVVDVLDEAAWNLDLEFADRPLDRAAVLHTLGSTNLALGRYDDAYDDLTAALELREDGLGSAHEDTLDTRTEAAHALFLKGEIEGRGGGAATGPRGVRTRARVGPSPDPDRGARARRRAGGSRPQ